MNFEDDSIEENIQIQILKHRNLNSARKFAKAVFDCIIEKIVPKWSMRVPAMARKSDEFFDHEFIVDSSDKMKSNIQLCIKRMPIYYIRVSFPLDEHMNLDNTNWECSRTLLAWLGIEQVPILELLVSKELKDYEF